ERGTTRHVEGAREGGVAVEVGRPPVDLESRPRAQDEGPERGIAGDIGDRESPRNDLEFDATGQVVDSRRVADGHREPAASDVRRVAGTRHPVVVVLVGPVERIAEVASATVIPEERREQLTRLQWYQHRVQPSPGRTRKIRDRSPPAERLAEQFV